VTELKKFGVYNVSINYQFTRKSDYIKMCCLTAPKVTLGVVRCVI